MKKTLSLFLSIIMLIITTVVPTSVGAEEDLITDEVISGEVDNTLPDTEESPEPTEEPTATPDAESTVSAEETMHNIVEKYTTYGVSEDINMHWFIADFVDYMSLCPESEYTLTDEEKQVCVDRIIESADNSTLQDELAKSIIALRALGYDAKNTYTKDGVALDIVAKLTDLITEESVTEPWYEYTLPYVMIALEVCGGNEEKVEFLIETAFSIKSAWQDTTWGTDGAAPMLRALAPYRADAEVAALIEETVGLVKSYQDENGSMGNAASTGIAIAGLASVGVDPESVIKNGKNLIDGLMYWSNDTFDGFKPTDSSFATEQGLRGLIAWKLFAEGKYIYDFAENPTNEVRATLDITPTPTPAPTEAPTPTPAPTRRPSYGGGGGVRTTPTPQPTAAPAPTPEGLSGKNADVAVKPVIFEDKTFDDIKEHKNQTAIESLASRGIIDGMDDVSYCPENTMTRAQFATIVVRALGVPERDGYNFADVNENDWFYSYVNTAYHYGIINGVSDTEFNPEGEISREEMVTMTARAAKLCGMMTDYNEESIRNTLAEFPDYITVSDWAMPAMAFCYYEKLLDGSVMNIEPKTKITRAEMAQLLYNMLGKAKLI